MKHMHIKLVFICFILMVNNVHAYDYDPLLMRAQATIFPKIILLDKDLSRKMTVDQIVITVLYDSQDKNIALKLKELMTLQYKNNLGEKQLTVNVVDFDKFDETVASTAYILLKSSETMHGKITAHAASKQRLVFSYDYKDFQNNVLISILVKEKTYIYLNKSALHDYDIKFLPLFYKIVKVIE